MALLQPHLVEAGVGIRADVGVNQLCAPDRLCVALVACPEALGVVLLGQVDYNLGRGGEE